MFEPQMPRRLSKIDGDERIGVDRQLRAVRQFDRPDFTEPRRILDAIGLPDDFDGRRIETTVARQDRNSDHAPAYQTGPLSETIKFSYKQRRQLLSRAKLEVR